MNILDYYICYCTILKITHIVYSLEINIREQSPETNQDYIKHRQNKFNDNLQKGNNEDNARRQNGVMVNFKNGRSFLNKLFKRHRIENVQPINNSTTNNDIHNTTNDHTKTILSKR